MRLPLSLCAAVVLSGLAGCDGEPSLMRSAASSPAPQARRVTPPARRQARRAKPTRSTPQPRTTGASLSREKVVALLEQATVMVLSPSGHGSGFFVAPQTVVTNAHVVEAHKTLVVLGGPFKGPTIARVVARTSTDRDGDYAVLDVPNAPNAAILRIAGEPAKLSAIYAAGYPGVVVSDTASYRELAEGNLRARPSVALAEGKVLSLHRNQHQLDTVAHDAVISGGSSGGPLVDRCGRVVGVNTYIRGELSGGRAGFALSTVSLRQFLQRALPGRVQPQEQPCRD